MGMHQSFAQGQRLRLFTVHADLAALILDLAQSGDSLPQKRSSAGVFRKLCAGDTGRAVTPGIFKALQNTCRNTLRLKNIRTRKNKGVSHLWQYSQRITGACMKLDTVEQFPCIRVFAGCILDFWRKKHQRQRAVSPFGAQTFHFQRMLEGGARKWA